jgi:hypothetical protein
MYEDLNQIAQLKLNKEVESISRNTREKVTEAQREYAALTGSSVGQSGQHQALIGRIQIGGAEQSVRALYQIWVDLINKRKGHVSRPDLAFVAGKIDGYAHIQRGHLHRAFVLQRSGAVANLLTEEAERNMYAVAASLRMDLEIMVRELEAFTRTSTTEKEPGMISQPKRRFSPGRRVLVGHQSRPGKVVSVDDAPGQMGEFRHTVAMDADGQEKAVMGCDLQAFPELDEDLSHKQPPSVSGPVFHGDQIINNGVVGAVGRNSQGIVNPDRQQAGFQPVDLAALAVQLEHLRAECRKTATSREDDRQIALLVNAADAAERGDETSVASILARAGSGVLKKATDIGADIVAKVIVGLAKDS